MCALVSVPLLVGFNFFVLNRNRSGRLLPRPRTPCRHASQGSCHVVLSFHVFISICLSHFLLPFSRTADMPFPSSRTKSYSILHRSGEKNTNVIWGHLLKVEKPEPPTCSCSSKLNLPSAELLENVLLSHLKMQLFVCLANHNLNLRHTACHNHRTFLY